MKSNIHKNVSQSLQPRKMRMGRQREGRTEWSREGERDRQEEEE